MRSKYFLISMTPAVQPGGKLTNTWATIKAGK
jgi:hypothetical protein